MSSSSSSSVEQPSVMPSSSSAASAPVVSSSPPAPAATQSQARQEAFNTEVLRALESYKKKYDALSSMFEEERSKISKLTEERNKLNEQLGVFRKEKEDKLKGTIDARIKPFLDTVEKLVPEGDKETMEMFGKAKSDFLSQINTKVGDIGPDGSPPADLSSTLAVIQAAASATQAQTTALERFYQQEKALQKRLEEGEAKMKEQVEALEAKNKLVEELQNKLKDMESKYSDSKANLNNVESHFEDSQPQGQGESHVPSVPPMEQTTPVAAAASNAPTSSGFSSLFEGLTFENSFNQPIHSSISQDLLARIRQQ